LDLVNQLDAEKRAGHVGRLANLVRLTARGRSQSWAKA